MADLKKRRERKKSAERFRRSRMANNTYQKYLRSVVHQIGALVKGMAPKGIVESPTRLVNALMRYAEILNPWAEAVAQNMVKEVMKRDAYAWQTAGRAMGRELTKKLNQPGALGDVKGMVTEQVDLITSIPRKAAERVQQLAIESVSSSSARANEIAREIMKTEEVSWSRAKMIARTETARAGAAMTESRARYIGSTGYVWHSQRDPETRPLHRKLDGKVFKWDNPPVIGENGERGHPGTIYNCRCWAEPVIPDEF